MDNYLRNAHKLGKIPYYLSDQFNDFSSIVNPVDKSTGKARFSVPLIKMQLPLINLKFDLMFDGNYDKASVFGKGWSLLQETNFILFQHSSSFFKNENRYYIFYESGRKQLEFVKEEKNENDTVRIYKLLNKQSTDEYGKADSNEQKEVKNRELIACHHVKKNFWEIKRRDGIGIIKYYGDFNIDQLNTNETNTIWELKNQVGIESTIPVIWHLREIRSSDYISEKIVMRYKTLNKFEFDGKSYASELHLQQIHLFNNLNNNDVLEFFYDENNLITSCFYTTKQYYQAVYFEYKNSTLTGIYEKDKEKSINNHMCKISEKPYCFEFMKFSYDNSSKQRISEIKLHTGVQVKLLYKNDNDIHTNLKTDDMKTWTSFASGRKDFRKSRYQFIQGYDYYVISYFDLEEINLLVHHLHIVGLDFPVTGKLKETDFYEKIERLPSYTLDIWAEVHHVAMSVVLVFKNDEKVFEIMIYDRKDVGLPWKQVFNIKLDNVNSVTVGSDYLITKNQVIWKAEDTQQWKITNIFPDYETENNTDYEIFVGFRDRKIILFYTTESDFTKFIIGYRNGLDKWNFEDLKGFDTKRIKKNIREKRLSLEQELIDHAGGVNKKNVHIFREYFRSFALQFYENIIVISYVDRSHQGIVAELFTMIETYAINESFHYIENTNQSHRMTYVTGLSLHEVARTNKLRNLFVSLIPPGVITCGTTNISLHENFKMKIENIEKDESVDGYDFALENEYILKRNLSVSIPHYKLIRKSDNKELHNFNIISLKSISIQYPAYIANVKDDKLEVTRFKRNRDVYIGNITGFSMHQKFFNPTSNIRTLIIEQNENSNNTFFFITMYNDETLPSDVIIRRDIILDSETKLQRSTGYDYNFGTSINIGNKLFFTNVTLLPGNNRSEYGWIEEVRGEGKIYYDNQGTLIKMEKIMTSSEDNQNQSTNQKDNDEIVDDHFYLYNKKENLIIVDFKPYKPRDEEVGYYGFENYELNIIGKKIEHHKMWKFNHTRILTNAFSFTGQNVLHLENNEKLEGNFEPKNQNKKYVVSTWIYPVKIEKSIEIGGLLDYLTVSIGTSSSKIYIVLSECKQEMNGWFYLEAIIDLNLAREIGKEKGVEGNLQINIKIMSGDNSSIYIDHVRFLPLGNSFEAYVYDPISELVTEVIQANGLIRRQIYDKYEKLLASTDEYGHIKEIHTYGKYDAKNLLGKELSSETKIEVETGFHQRFNKVSFENNWIIKGNKSIEYHNDILRIRGQYNEISLKRPDIISSKSYGIRFVYGFYDTEGKILFNKLIRLQKKNNETKLRYNNNKILVPDFAEMILILENNRIFIWTGGHLKFEVDIYTEGIEFEFEGSLFIQDMILFNEPRVEVIYKNKLGEKVQELQLISENSVIITEYLYDELGRQAITTRPKIMDGEDELLLEYHSDWVTNDNPRDADSVWQKNKLFGRIGVTNYFVRTTFAKNPLDEQYKIILPNVYGSVFSDDKQFVGRTNNEIIRKLYPHEKGYNYQVKINQEIINDITVYDKNENKVAWLLDVENCENCTGAISTYKYNEAAKLIEMMPPMWYDLNDALLRHNITALPEHQEKRQYYGTFIEYNKAGKIISKKTQDTALTKYLYDKNELLRYVVYTSNADMNDATVIYFEYDQFARLINTGRVKNHMNTKLYKCLVNNDPETKCEEVVDDNDKEEYQQFYYSDYEPEVIFRGRLKRTVTFNDAIPLIEEIRYNGDEKTLSKRIIYESIFNNKNITGFGKDETHTKIPALQVRMRYSGDRLKEIEYPIETEGVTFKIIYEYGKHGKITKIGRPGSPQFFSRITYNAYKFVDKEWHRMGNGSEFLREYKYNDFGYLQSIDDDFLTQTLYFTGEYHGDRNYTDGTIARTKFRAKWHENVRDEDKDKIRLSVDSFNNEKHKACFSELKKEKYFTSNGFQSKIFFPESYDKISSECNCGIEENTFASLLSKKGFPKLYGYNYEYGNYGELREAKYFVGQKRIPPLDATAFMKIKEVDERKANIIWDILKKNKFIGVRNYSLKDSRTHGREIRRDYFRDDEFNKIFNNMETTCAFRRWFLSVNSPTSLARLVENLPPLFLNKNFQILKTLKTSFKSSILDNQTHIGLLESLWSTILKQDDLFLITKILHQHFSEDLGKAEFDVQFNDIDSNGNIRCFRRGFEEFKLTYKEHTNQVEKMSFAGQSYDIKHDSRGNVIQALHKKIKKITYHPVSNRPIEVDVGGGTTVSFDYDSNGERFSKRVKINGKLIKEIFYIRDESMRPLVESQVSYSDGTKDQLITAYVYGPRGLIGFIRRNKYYNVITDHAGSIRLVINDGKVVAAYDYLPFGTLMREFASCADAQISYRYTGQEWDEELGLYNYHARLYDPTIGRFYQIDPKEQYFSPYKYAGNSPISMVDPNGEFVVTLLLVIFGALAGAYLGGATANNNWNLIKWNWKSSSTWLGIFGGGIAGALLAPGFMATASIIGSSATFALGAGAAYLGAAAANKNLDITKWNWRSPSTYYGLFSGFGVGSGLVGNVVSFGKSFQSLSLLGKVGYIGSSTAYAGVSIYMQGSKYKWDFSNPEMWYGFLESIQNAANFPIAMGSGNFFSKLSNVKTLAKIRGINVFNDMKKLLTNVVVINKSFLKNIPKASMIAGGVVAAGARNNWDMTNLNTYYDMIQGGVAGYRGYRGLKTIRKNVASWNKYSKIRKDVSVKNIENVKKTAYDGIQSTIVEKFILATTITSWFPTKKLIVVESPNFKIIFATKKFSSPILDIKSLSGIEGTETEIVRESRREIINIAENLQHDPNKTTEFKIVFKNFIKKVNVSNYDDLNKYSSYSFNIDMKYLLDWKIYLYNYFEVETADPLWEYSVEKLYNQSQKRPRRKRSLIRSDFIVLNKINDSSYNLSAGDATTIKTVSSPVKKQISYDNNITFNNFESEKQSYSANNASSFISYVDAHVDINSTLFLVDLFVRKITGKRFINTTLPEMSVLDIQIQAMKIVEKVEKFLKKVAKQLRISKNDLLFDPVDLQLKIYKKLLNGKYSEVTEILKSSIKQSVPNAYNVEEFLKYFCEYLKPNPH